MELQHWLYDDGCVEIICMVCKSAGHEDAGFAFDERHYQIFDGILTDADVMVNCEIACSKGFEVAMQN